MNELITISGMAQVGNMKFHDIEGGFGPGKKAMLAKDIADIHGRELKVVNQNINRNRERFTDGVDIVDLKGTNFEVTLSDHGIMTQNSINRASNIYILSERGYSKLLKILEDDIAWGQYEKLVDGYFNLRAAGKAVLAEGSERTRAMYINAITRQAKLLYQMTNVDTLSTEYKNILVAKAAEIVAGAPILPPVKSVQKTLSATEVGKILGISANMVGTLANRYGLKTKEYGELYRDKSPYSSKEVDSFRYYEAVIPKLEEILREGSA